MYNQRVLFGSKRQEGDSLRVASTSFSFGIRAATGVGGKLGPPFETHPNKEATTFKYGPSSRQTFRSDTRRDRTRNGMFQFAKLRERGLLLLDAPLNPLASPERFREA